MMVLLDKQIGGGEGRVSFGSGERPRYSALARAIDGMYADLQPPLAELREAVFTVTGLPDALTVTKESPPPFRFTAAMRRVIDGAVEKFLTAIAGPDRSRKGFVEGGPESETPDGILQQRELLTYQIGLRRAADLIGAAQTLVPARSDPAVTEMLDHAFLRLSDSGKLRLESVKDEIHGVLVGATDAGISPVDTARQLTKQFTAYKGWEFERLARTESAFAAEAGTREQLREFGVTHLMWLLSAGACPICTAFEGKAIPIDEVASLPPQHPNCCCSTQPVTGGLP